MKFKILKGTPLFAELKEFEKKCRAADKAANDFVKTIPGAKERATSRKVAGGIDAIKFDSKPEGWRVVGETWQRLYYPKRDKANKELLEQIGKLPVIDYEDLNKIVGFKFQTISSDRGLMWVSTVGLVWGNELILIETEEGCDYKPKPDMIEILESEYLKLQKELLASRKKKPVNS